MSTTPSPAPHIPSSLQKRGQWPLVVGASLLLTVVAALMLLAFAAPALGSGAHHLPVGLSGPDAAVAKVSAALKAQSPDAFDLTTYSSPDDLVTAIQNRDLVGGIAVSASGVTVYTAGGAGAPYSTLLKAIGGGLAASGTKVSYTDLAPLTPNDPSGLGLATLALPLVFGGMASAVVLVAVVRARPAGRVVGSLLFSALAGVTTTAVLQYGFHAISGPYWLTSLGVAAGVAAISLTVLGLESVLGYGGLALGAVTMLFVANPLSGLSAGPQWLPAPWGAVGQYLPLGAAGTAIRSAAYFDGRGATAAWIVLGAWIVVGLLLVLVAQRRRRPAGAEVAAV